MSDPKPTRRRRRRLRPEVADARAYGIVAFFTLTFVGALIGLLFFLRPSTSVVEKRELTTFPELTADAFMDGSYFESVALWYADTYPAREPLVSFDQTLTGFYGLRGETMMVGGNVEADTLPPEGDGEVVVEEEEERGPVEVPEAGVMQKEMNDRIMSGLYVKNGAAYSIYYFVQDAVQSYVNAINAAAEALDGTSTVYSIVVPNNSGAILDEDELEALGGTDQAQAIDYMYSLYNDSVHPVSIYDALREHRDEYIYFRTDHHWTQLGAYYAYVEFCEERGVEPADIEDWETETFDNFLGSFYTELRNAEMAANPDTIEAYVPTSTNDLTYWDASGASYDAHVINDTRDWGAGVDYMTFITGDRPLVKIENPDLDDGSSVLLIEDSYGCAFAPWLVDDYETIYVMDFRAHQGNFVDFAKENSIDDVIFLNNMTIADSSGVGAMLMSKIAS